MPRTAWHFQDTGQASPNPSNFGDTWKYLCLHVQTFIYAFCLPGFLLEESSHYGGTPKRHCKTACFCVKLCTAKLCLENQNKTYRDQSYPKAFPQINKRESNFPCSLAQITPDNKQRFNTHSVSLARAWANEYR